jgi:hypothetical protein
MVASTAARIEKGVWDVYIFNYRRMSAILDIVQFEVQDSVGFVGLFCSLQIFHFGQSSGYTNSRASRNKWKYS